MADNSDEAAAEQRRRRLRAALDAQAPEPSAVADRSEAFDAGAAPADERQARGLVDEDLLRERPPHHG